MSWKVNQPSNSNWVNNATDSSIGVTSYKVGKTTLEGYKVNDSKKLYFGTDRDFHITFESNKFQINYLNPLTGSQINILQYNPTDDSVDVRNLSLSSPIFSKVNADNQGSPLIPAQDGKMVYTENQHGAGSFWLGHGEAQGQDTP